MKKGSRAMHCNECGKIIFWKVPTESVLGIQFIEHKNVVPWKYMKVNNSLSIRLCEDCYKKKKGVSA